MDSEVDFSSFMVQPEAAPVENVPAAEKAVAKKTAATKKPEPVESDDRTALLARLNIMFVTFPAKLKEIKPKSLDKLSDDELQEINQKVQLILGAKGGVDGFAAMFPHALKFVEDLVADFTPLRIQGTHEVCFQPEVQDMIKYTIIDMGFGGLQMNPTQRLALTLITTGAQRHSMNTAIEKLSPEQRAQMAADLKRVETKSEPVDDKYSDL